MSIFKESISAILFSTISVVLHFFINFVILYIIVNLYTSYNYATYSLIINFYWFFLIIATFGMEPAIIRFLSNDKINLDKIQRIISNGFRWILLFSSLTSSFIFISADFFEDLYSIPYLALNLRYISLFLFFTNIIHYFEIVFRGLNKFKLYAISSISLNILKLCIVLFNFYKILDITIIFSLYALISFIHFSIMILYMQLKYKIFNRILIKDPLLTKTIFISTLMIFFPLLFSYLSQRFNIFILAYYITPLEFSIYNVTLLLIDIVALPIIIFNIVILPMVSRYMQNFSKDKINNSFNFFLNIGLLYMIPVSVMFFFLSDMIIVVFFPIEYLPSSAYVRTFLIYTILRMIGIVGPNFLYANNQLKTILKLTGITAMIILILSFILIPILYIYGAILSIIIPQSIYLIYSVFLVKRRNLIKLNRKLILSILKYLASSLLSLIITQFLSVVLKVNLFDLRGLVLFSLLYLISFLIFVFIMKAVDVNLIKFFISEFKENFNKNR